MHTLVALRHAHISAGSSSLDVPAISTEVSCELLRTHAWMHKVAKRIIYWTEHPLGQRGKPCISVSMPHADVCLSVQTLYMRAMKGPAGTQGSAVWMC